MAPRTILSDRFIPCQSSSNFDLFHASLPTSDKSTAYNAMLRSALFGPKSASSNIFKFKTETRKPMESLLPFELDNDELISMITPTARKIDKTPSKILDAPELEDNFYRDLVDWSPRNVLAVGLGSCVYLLQASNGRVQKLFDFADDGDSVCSVSWAKSGSDHLAVGTINGKMQIWDASKCRRIRSMEGHSDNVVSLAWSSSCSTLASGSRDKTILNRDIRKRDDFVSKLTGHRGAVCGLKWSHDDEKLASGGDDDQLLVWNRRSTKPILKYTEHKAAVRAIAWSPHQHGLLASGGGTADRFIRFWDTDTNRQTSLSSVETGSQVCKLAWSDNVNEIVSTHGYLANEIMLWEYPKMSKVATLRGHTSRVLHLAVSPDGRQIVTGAGDETIRFWNVFPKSTKSRKPENGLEALSLGMRSHIR